MDRSEITTELAARLVASQFPEWATLSVRPVDVAGWDNVTFRLGDDKTVRLPSGPAYEAQVEKEHRWLPYLSRHLPLPIPRPLALGAPGPDFPRRWSIYQWIPGMPAARDAVDDLDRFAADLAEFLRKLYEVDPTGGPRFASHSFRRGGPVNVWDEEARETIALLRDEIDTAAALAAWDLAVASDWDRPGVWVHGDVAETNLLVDEAGRLSAVLDFGCSAVGDPACDLTIAWTFLRGRSREVFRQAVGVDEGTWARGRGWALWKALIGLRYDAERAAGRKPKPGGPREVIAEVLLDHGASG